MMTLILSAVWLTQWCNRRTRDLRGCCPTCGYDLRATPQRCSEGGVQVLEAA
jgi:hypothetical protein